MKKFTLLLSGILCALMLNVQAQTDVYNNDFEAYTVGAAAAQAMGAPWTTWSLNPGGADDAAISSTQAHGGTKSIGIVNADDLVFEFNDLTAGRYTTEWYMFVETGKLGYFNFLSEFAGTGSNWALQAFIINDSIYVDAGGPTAAKSPFTFNTWNNLKLITDLDDDFATLYLNGTEIISYQWSKGAEGADNLLKLDGINFYGWDNDGAGTAGYYIDDLNIDSVAAPNAPSTLDAVINGVNIDVTWTAPVPAPELYKLSCNGSVVYTGTNLSYTQVAPWPYTYHYKARARYTGQGYSHSSNEDSVTITGGISRDLVLMEGGTGMWCTYCPGAAMGLHDLIEVNLKDAAAIEYHSGDSLESAATLARIGYYNMTGFPTVVADGKLVAVGGSHTVSAYPTYLNMYNERINYPSHHTLNVNVVEIAPGFYQATIVVQQIYEAVTSGIKLHTALTESNLPYSWQGQSKVDYACRGMFPDENGTDLDFSVQNPITTTINFSTGGHIKNNCEFVVFVQYNSLKEVTQTAKVDMSSVTGVSEIQGTSINLYPNPASEYIIAGTNGKGTLEIYDMTGKLVLSKAIREISQVIDVRGLTRGVYAVKVYNGENTFVEKIIIE